MELRAKKSLGQNFLKDKSIVGKIIEASDIKSDDFVLEIGPGKGILTKELTKITKVIAVEKDEELAKKTADDFQFSIFNFKSISNKPNINFQNNAAIIIGDILEINIPELITSYGLPVTGYKVIANIPYYITSKIIRLFLENLYPPKEMILMVQKEVAERIVAEPGNMSILAVSVQYYAKPELLFYVGKENFDPVPEVDSAVIRITCSKQFTTNNEERKKFFRVVKAGFSAKRKTLLNNLSNSFHLDKKEVEEKLKAVPLSGTARAQELSIEDWKKLAGLF